LKINAASSFIPLPFTGKLAQVLIWKKKRPRIKKIVTHIVDGKWCFQKTLILAFQHKKIPSRMREYKWGLLKGREREIQREHGRVHVESSSKESILFFFRCF
jgi:hypothetical protein